MEVTKAHCSLYVKECDGLCGRVEGYCPREFSTMKNSKSGSHLDLIRRRHEFPVQPGGYKIGDVLGKGGFGIVHRGVCVPTNDEVAIKIVNLDVRSFGSFESVLREISILQQIQNDRIISHLAVYIDFYSLDKEGSNDTSPVSVPSIHIVFPFIDGFSLSYFLRGEGSTGRFRNGIKDNIAISVILRQVLKALVYAHSSSIAHRDIKSSNILVSREGKVYLIDFGVAKTLDQPFWKNQCHQDDNCDERNDFPVGTLCWMSPEILSRNRSTTFKTDIWSLGIFALELAYREPPYYGLPAKTIERKIIEEDAPNHKMYKDDSYDFSDNFHKFVSLCLAKDPENRPSATDLLKHPFIKKYRFRKHHYLKKFFFES